MNIVISNSSSQPIYDQITTQVKNMVLSGELKEGDALPSMRLLAKELRISVITTKRAYEELEREGFINTQTGRGSFIASQNIDFVREQHLKGIEECLGNAVKKAKLSGISLDELMEMLSMEYHG